MKKTDFTQNTQVLKQISEIKKITKDKRYSDVLDAKGLQYVDLVLEGGGVLGLALVGYTYALEQAGIRFRSTAGTSAGAINALLLQAMGGPSDARSEKMIASVASMPMDDFQDGGWDGKMAVAGWLKNKLPKKLISAFLLDDILFRYGLNPGDEFHSWMTEELAKRKVASWGEMKAQMNKPVAGIGVYEENDANSLLYPISADRWRPELKIVSAEMCTTTKVIFPEKDGSLFYSDLDKANPADFARASMSVPVFFEPFKLANIPSSPEHKKKWAMRGHNGPIPKEAIFLDGGIISNFPISAFHNYSNVPRMPTFGVKLGVAKGKLNKINSIINLAGAAVNVMRFDSDEEFLCANPDYHQLVKAIPTGKHHWLNFELKDEEKVDLFRRGVVAAKEFLKGFDWAGYKNTRKQLLGIANKAG
ncbi:NTE family protein [Alteromonadaceae bacterium Bs31]|nr:NTE family protein [Alteromonadaceae bacterium Bs31]